MITISEFIFLLFQGAPDDPHLGVGEGGLFQKPYNIQHILNGNNA